MTDQLLAVRRIGVVGAGVMGTSIAHLCSDAGAETTVKVRRRAGAIEQARQSLHASYAREVGAGRLSRAGAQEALRRVRVTDDYADLAQAEIVLESVPEDLGIKQEVIRSVEAVTGPDTIIASNTSSLLSSALASASARPKRIVNMHYFWPAHRQALLEISTTQDAEYEVVERVRALGRQQQRVELLVHDSPGLFTTRILMPYVSEAILLVAQGVPLERVDAALEAFGWPMGPFRLMDAAGVETIAYVHDCLRPFLGERIAGLARLWPMVREGYLGRRVGLGFYEYGPACRQPNPAVNRILATGKRPGEPDPDELVKRPVWMMLAEAARSVAEGVVADWEHADLGANLGLVFPQKQGGLLAYRNRVGDAALRRQFRIWERRYGPRFRLES